jgi:hypothetical protein
MLPLCSTNSHPINQTHPLVVHRLRIRVRLHHAHLLEKLRALPHPPNDGGAGGGPLPTQFITFLLNSLPSYSNHYLPTQFITFLLNSLPSYSIHYLPTQFITFLLNSLPSNPTYSPYPSSTSNLQTHCLSLHHSLTPISATPFDSLFSAFHNL